MRFINRELRRIIEDIGTFTNPDDPLELTGYVIGNPGEGFFGGPFDKPKRQYNALELIADSARSPNRWHLNSSFVYAQARGNHEGLYMSGYDQLDPNITALYDIPSFLPNSDGGCGPTSRISSRCSARIRSLGTDAVGRLHAVGGRADFGAGAGDRQRLR